MDIFFYNRGEVLWEEEGKCFFGTATILFHKIAI